MQRFFIIILLISVYSGIAAMPDLADRFVQRELKRQFSKTEFELVELAIPSKYNASGKFYLIKTAESAAHSRYMYIGRVNTYRTAAGNSKSGASAEYFDYMILFDAERTVRQVRILNYQASHGEMIAAPGWLRKFEGHHHKKPLEVGRQIDAISGATLSVNGITFDVRQKTFILSEIAVR